MTTFAPLSLFEKPPSKSPPPPSWRRPKESHPLRDYQTRAIRLTGENLRESGSTLIVMATGLGKTVTFAHAIKQLCPPNKRALVLAHRQELVEQNAKTIGAVLGEPCGIEMSDRHGDLPGRHKSRVIVASKDSLHESRIKIYDPSEFGLLIDDEAHHSTADSYRRIHKYFKGVPHIGVTATPDRHDEEALGQVFTSVAMVYGIADGINDGWLVPVRAHTPFITEMKLDTVKTVAGDFNQGELSEIMERDKVLHEVAASVTAESGNRRAIIFAVSVRQAALLAEILNGYQPDSARWVCGETPKDQRQFDLAEHRAGRYKYVVNVGVLTEGYDDPGCSLIVMARPTKSRALFTQMIGRGTRPLPGIVDGPVDASARRAAIAASIKPDLMVLSYTGNCGRHSLVTPADILGGNYSEEDIESASAMMQGEEMDVAEALAKAQRGRLENSTEAMEELRDARESRARIVALAQYMLKEEDLFDGAVMPGRERNWIKGKPPTDPQLDTLEKAGFTRTDCERMSRIECSRLIGEVITRRAKGLATLRQVAYLTRRGFKDAASMTFADAGAAIGKLHGVRP